MTVDRSEIGGSPPALRITGIRKQWSWKPLVITLVLIGMLSAGHPRHTSDLIVLPSGRVRRAKVDIKIASGNPVSIRFASRAAIDGRQSLAVLSRRLRVRSGSVA